MGQDQSSQLKHGEAKMGADGAGARFHQCKVKRRNHQYYVSSGNLEGVENIETILQENDLSPLSDDGRDC